MAIGTDNLRLLLIGPLPPPLGGVSVLFEHLVFDLTKSTSIETEIIDTGNIRGKGINSILRFISLVWQIAKSARTADVVTLHSATSGLHITGPLVAFFARLNNKPLIIRKFGGTDFFKYKPIRRYLIIWALRRAQIYLAETQYLVRIAHENGLIHAGWFSNSRPMPPDDIEKQKKQCNRFVYLGQIRKIKGIYEIIKAAELFANEIVVDIYGPLDFDVSREDFNRLEKVRYCGVVDPKNVIQVMRNYDILLLPTAADEGYPGVILEAYAAGLPVICTRMGAIQEIVDNTTGILIEPRNVNALYEAMQSLIDSEELYNKLVAGVQAKRRSFSSQIWTEKFIEYCRKVGTLN